MRAGSLQRPENETVVKASPTTEAPGAGNFTGKLDQTCKQLFLLTHASCSKKKKKKERKKEKERKGKKNLPSSLYKPRVLLFQNQKRTMQERKVLPHPRPPSTMNTGVSDAGRSVACERGPVPENRRRGCGCKEGPTSETRHLSLHRRTSGKTNDLN